MKKGTYAAFVQNVYSWYTKYFYIMYLLKIKGRYFYSCSEGLEESKVETDLFYVTFPSEIITM